MQPQGGEGGREREPKLPPATNLTTDINEYAFPTHIVSMDLCPDIVWWDNQNKTLMLVELTISMKLILTMQLRKRK